MAAVPPGPRGLGIARAGAPGRADDENSRWPRSGRRRTRLVHRAVRWFGVLCLPLTMVTAWSMISALTVRGNLSNTERFIEWLRDHHMGNEVSTVERWYYSHHQPPEGGTLAGTLPAAATAQSPADSAGSAGGADIVQPFVATTVPGEGRWAPLGDRVDGVAVMQAAYLRPDSVHTGLLAAVVRIDQQRVRFRLVPGRTVPGHGPWPGGNGVPAALVPRLLAGFNSAFRIEDAHGGFFEAGRTVGQLIDGAASFVIDKDGKISIGAWGRDVRLAADTVAVRQNLSLIVDGGELTSGLDSNSDRRWGKTVGNTLLVWRSGIGIDAGGNLLYAASDGLSVRSLAALLKDAGAVRAMELDINHSWVSFNTFAHHGDSLVGAKLLSGMKKSASRYLGPDDRDFVAVLAPEGSARLTSS